MFILRFAKNSMKWVPTNGLSWNFVHKFSWWWSVGYMKKKLLNQTKFFILMSVKIFFKFLGIGLWLLTSKICKKFFKMLTWYASMIIFTRSVRHIWRGKLDFPPFFLVLAPLWTNITDKWISIMYSTPPTSRKNFVQIGQLFWHKKFSK